MFTLTISEKEAIHLLAHVVKGIGAKELAKNIPKEDYLLLIDLLKDGVEVGVLEALEHGLEYFRKHHKHVIHDQSGFAITKPPGMKPAAVTT